MNLQHGIEHVAKHTRDPEYFSGLFEGYVAARGDDLVPTFSDFVLQDQIVPRLTGMTVLDLGLANIASYRLCGSAVVSDVGLDLTGLDLLEFVPADAKNGLYADLMAMINFPCGNFSLHSDRYASGKAVQSETLSLPLRADKGSPINLVASLYLSERIVLDTARGPLEPGAPDMKIGIEWSESTSIDIGNGIPGLTSVERRKSL